MSTPLSGSTIDSTGTWIFRSSGLRTPVSTIVHVRRGPTRKRPTSSSGDCVALRPMRWTSRSASASRRSRVSARCAPRLVCGHGVDLVDDHPLGAGEHLPGLRGEDEVQRLGRRDEHVGRLASHGRALALGRVAGADGDVDVGADALQRSAEVALDVVGERLERRDVDEPRPLLPCRQRVAREPVEPPQEGGQRLARAGGRRDEDVLAGGDGRPRLFLRGRRRLERALEPLSNAGAELLQRHLTEDTEAGQRGVSRARRRRPSSAP